MPGSDHRSLPVVSHCRESREHQLHACFSLQRFSFLIIVVLLEAFEVVERFHVPFIQLPPVITAGQEQHLDTDINTICKHDSAMVATYADVYNHTTTKIRIISAPQSLLHAVPGAMPTLLPNPTSS